MLLFLRIVASLLILFASWSLAIAGPRDGKNNEPPDIHIRMLEPGAVQEWTPWITLRQVSWKTPGTAYEFVIRPDLQPAVLESLKKIAVEFKYRETAEYGIWIRVVAMPDDLFERVLPSAVTESLLSVRADEFYFFGYGSRVPSWLRARILFAGVLDSVNWSARNVIQPGDYVASLNQDQDYPIDPEARIADLLRTHALKGNSVLCANFLRRMGLLR